jgi:mannose-6-phosphate isomerase-like protein (cupin superfamily)
VGAHDDAAEITVLGSTYRFLADGAATGGRYSLCEKTFWGDPPPLHVHEAEEESFYVLDGHGSVSIGGTEHPVAAGSFVLVPRGVPHTLHRTSQEPLRMLTLVSPAGFEQFFVEIAATPGGEDALDEEALVALAARYGCRFVDSPS